MSNLSTQNEFISSATATIKEVITTIHERGSQYCDSWGKSATWHLTKAAIKKVLNVDVTDEQASIIGLAVFIDQKYSRFSGGYKRDTALDLIPYIAAFVDKTKE
jgi:hypothetical protein